MRLQVGIASDADIFETENIQNLDLWRVAKCIQNSWWHLGWSHNKNGTDHDWTLFKELQIQWKENLKLNKNTFSGAQTSHSLEKNIFRYDVRPDPQKLHEPLGMPSPK